MILYYWQIEQPWIYRDKLSRIFYRESNFRIGKFLWIAKKTYGEFVRYRFIRLYAIVEILFKSTKISFIFPSF